MESITDHIKSLAQHTVTPADLKSRVMDHVTNTESVRDSVETERFSPLPQQSPYQRKAYWILSGTIIASVLFVVQATTLSPTNTLTPMNVAEEIVAEYQNNSDTVATQSYAASEYIDSLQTIQNLVYVDSGT